MQHQIKPFAESNSVFNDIIQQYGVPTVTVRRFGFVSMVHLILEQQVSIASAQACMDKLALHLGEITPQNILKTTDEDLKKCGISRQKANYIKNLSEKTISNEFSFESLEKLPEEEVYQNLISLKGVGRWTAEVFMLFCMQKTNVFPVGDIAIQHTMRELFNCQTIEEMEIFSEIWKPNKSLATFLLWHHYLGKRNRL